jgi:acetyltransferase-like isoleucine patch superfamily enzyme
VFTTLALGLLPHSRLKLVLVRSLLNWEIDPDVHFGPCLFLHVRHVRADRGAQLYGLSFYHSLDELVLGTNAVIGYWNTVGGASVQRVPIADGEPDIRPGQLHLERESAITSRHYIDCSAGVLIGEFTILAGVRSTILTHQVDTASSRHDLQPVRIGAYCFIGSNVSFVPGSSVPERCIVGMGAVVVEPLAQPGMLYVGVPARPIKPVETGDYFRRDTGMIAGP